MEDPGSREGILVHQSVVRLPRNTALLTTPAQPILPCTLGFVENNLKASKIPAYAVILVVPLQFLAESLVLCFHCHMAIVSAPLPKPSYCAFLAFAHRLPLNDPISTSRFSPVVGESEKIECAVPTFAVPLGPWFSEVHQRRLLRMYGKVEATKPLR